MGYYYPPARESPAEAVWQHYELQAVALLVAASNSRADFESRHD